MTITETVQGPDGRLYLVLRKIEEPYSHNTTTPAYKESEESRVIIIDMNEDDDSIIEFEFN